MMISTFLFVLTLLVDPIVSFSPSGGYIASPSACRYRLEAPRIKECFRKGFSTFHRSTATSSESDVPEGLNEQPEKETNLAMPWSEFQDWALRDNLPRYVVSIPKSGDGDTMELYALWRTMTREVTELCGYPIDFLQDMYSRFLKQNPDSPVQVVPGLLPQLDEFDFEPSGGVSGRVHGITGVADGTKIETPAVADVHETVAKGYVRTVDGSVAYELGTPLRDSYSLDGISRGASIISQAATKASKASTNLSPLGGSDQEDPDAMLLRLGVSTGILLGGAMAVNILSHHLTINVFWV